MESENKNLEFSVFQWNTLSSSLSDQKAFPKIPNKFLQWEYRKNLISQQLSSIKSDLVCLQEVDHPKFYENIFKPLGYFCFAKQKLRCPVPGGIPDGLFFAINKEKFNIIQEPIYQIFQEKNGTNMNQLFGICKLQLKSAQCPHEIWLIGTHLKARKPYEEKRIQQVEQIINYIKNDKNTPKNLGIVLCGDLNSEPETKSIQTLKNGINCNFVFEPKEGLFTTYIFRNEEECRIIDYIMINDCFKIIKNQQLPSKEEIGENGLPNEFYPSDHLPLITFLQMNEIKVSQESKK